MKHIFCVLIVISFIHVGQTQVTLEQSNLPIFVIDTEGKFIEDEPKVTARMGIIYNGEDQLNQITDPYNEYDGWIGIELRGSSSQFFFPKKGYAVETRNENGENNNVSLLELPKENDWILHGPYSDKSLIRNALAYKLAEQLMDYAPRTRLCELVINGDYMGVYLFTEKIKRDNNRVHVDELVPDENSGDELTGGYIIKHDKWEGVDNAAWESPYTPIPGTESQTLFMYHYPKPSEITEAQKEYIQGFISEFEDVLASPDFADPTNGYRKYIDVQTFINFMWVNEITKNVDGYRLSTFMYKDKNSIDGRLKMGPVWDFNLGFGNADYCEGDKTYGWALDFNDYCPGDYWVIHFWWKKLWDDPLFLDEAQKRWFALRQGPLQTETVMQCIDSLATLLEEPAKRNFVRWPVLGQYIWPNSFVGNTHEQELDFLKNWIEARLNWLDGQIDEFNTPVYNPEGYFPPKAYPNPASEAITFEYYVYVFQEVTIRIYNTQGQLIKELKDVEHLPNANSITWEFDVSPGMYLYTVHFNSKRISSGKLVKM